MEIISRKEALKRGLKRYFTGNPCKYNHISDRYCANNHCSECSKKDHDNLRVTGYIKIYNANHYLKNKESYNENSNAWRSKNRERVKEHDRKRREKYQAYYAALASKNRQKRNKRIPSWSDLNKVYEIYKECEIVSKKTGIKHHVDHEIPLQGKYVSGLHVPSNLKIIPAKENLQKSNKFTIE